MGKGRVVIAWSVNNDFEPLEKLTDRESGCAWLISRGRSGRYSIVSHRTMFTRLSNLKEILLVSLGKLGMQLNIHLTTY